MVDILNKPFDNLFGRFRSIWNYAYISFLDPFSFQF